MRECPSQLELLILELSVLRSTFFESWYRVNNAIAFFGEKEGRGLEMRAGTFFNLISTLYKPSTPELRKSSLLHSLLAKS